MEVTNTSVKTLAKVNVAEQKTSESEPAKEKSTMTASTDKVTLSQDALMSTRGTGGGAQKPPPSN